MTDRAITVQSIVARCGGAAALAARLPVSAWAVYKWSCSGIPDKYWEVVLSASDVTALEIYHANKTARTREAAEVAA